MQGLAICSHEELKDPSIRSRLNDPSNLELARLVLLFEDLYESFWLDATDCGQGYARNGPLASSNAVQSSFYEFSVS
jgi:hypothetical protein